MSKCHKCLELHILYADSANKKDWLVGRKKSKPLMPLFLVLKKGLKLVNGMFLDID